MESDNQFRSKTNRFRMMLRTNLSMHVMPVLLAFAFLFITEQNLRHKNGQADAEESTQTFQYVSPNNFALLNTGNIQHVVTIYRITRLAINVSRY